MRQRDREPGALLAFAGFVQDPDGLRCGLLLRGIAFAVAGPLMCAVQRELVRSSKKARATGATTGTIQDAVVIAQAGDLFIEMRRRFDGECAVANLSVEGVQIG